MADIIRVAANTGMRKGEIVKVGNPDREAGAHLNRETKSYTIFNCKNGKPRTLPLNDQAFEALCRLEDDHIHDYTHRKFYKRWGVLRQLFKLADDDVFHVMRHTHASMLANEQNSNVFLMNELLTHLNLKTTARYTHPDHDALKKLVDRQGVINTDNRPHMAGQ